VELGREDDEDEEEEERPLETVGNIFARSVRFDSFQLWKRSTNYSTLISSFWCDVMSCDLCVSLSLSGSLLPNQKSESDGKWPRTEM
jgi:hypothetical protein